MHLLRNRSRFRNTYRRKSSAHKKLSISKLRRNSPLVTPAGLKAKDDHSQEAGAGAEGGADGRSTRQKAAGKRQ